MRKTHGKREEKKVKSWRKLDPTENRTHSIKQSPIQNRCVLWRGVKFTSSTDNLSGRSAADAANGVHVHANPQLLRHHWLQPIFHLLLIFLYSYLFLHPHPMTVGLLYTSKNQKIRKIVIWLFGSYGYFLVKPISGLNPMLIFIQFILQIFLTELLIFL